MFTFPVTHFGEGARLFNPLGSLVPSTVCDLDATIGASFTSGQKWLNLEDTPADGSSQTQNDYFLGNDGNASTDDPTFNGTPDTVAAFFSVDGGDFWTHTDGVGAPNVPTVRDFQKVVSGNKWWVAIAFKTPATLANTFYWGNAINVPNIGLEFRANFAGTRINLDLLTGTTDQNLFGETTIVTSTDQLVIYSSDMGLPGLPTENSRIWRNTATKNQGSSVRPTSTSNADGVFRIGSSDNAGTQIGFLKADHRVYAFSYGNDYIDDADATLIKAEYEARHGRTYDT